ncbi:MAG: ABC transporter permease [Anaerolineae bacterium]|nr:ABC transporter permease [Anaerolineae bacterium]
MPVTWCKIWRDLMHSKARTTLVVLSTAIGVFVLGVILGAYGMMVDGLERDRLAWVPIHVTLWGQFDQEAEYAVLRDEDVVDVERLVDTVFHWRLAGETNWQEGRMVARRDYAAQRMGLVRLVGGRWPEWRTLAVEAMTAQDFGISPGDVVIVQSGQHERRLEIVGVVHDPDAGLPPRFGGGADFFATPETARWLTGADFGRLDVRIAPTPDVARSRAVADRVRARLDDLGMPASGAWVRDPDAHWSQDPLNALLLILTLTGALSLVLSVFLIVNTMNAIVAQQVWQIGVMKAVGATRARVARVYLALGLIYGALALLLAVPLGAVGAYRLAAWALGTLGIAVGPFQLTPRAVWVQIGVGLAVPLLAALAPVARGARVTVRRAIATYGLGGGFGRGPFDRLMGSIRRLPRPVALSLRNTFRHKARVTLTLAALALGGALFMALLSVEASCGNTIAVMLNDSGADVVVHFARAYRVERLLAATGQAPGVTRAEVWKRWSVRLRLAGGGERVILLVGVPPDSGILRPRIVAGRGLLPGDGNAILLNNKVAAEEGIAVGDEVRFDLQDRETTWTVVGLVRNAEERSFVPFDRLSGQTGSRNIGWEVAVAGEAHDPRSQLQLVDDLRATYAAQRFEADDFSSGLESRERVRSRFDVILTILLTIALLAAGVGGIGLMGTMAINVVERRREIGVMRATGATPAAIAAIFCVEGGVVGVLSWALAVPLSYPSARLFSDALGRVLLRSPFEFVYSLEGVGLWLGVVVVLSLLASLVPALRATRVSVREALAYE